MCTLICKDLHQYKYAYPYLDVGAVTMKSLDQDHGNIKAPTDRYSIVLQLQLLLLLQLINSQIQSVMLSFDNTLANKIIPENSEACLGTKKLTCIKPNPKAGNSI